MDQSDQRVRDALHDATKARDLAYAPYSGFKMGAAIVTDTNHVIKGSLVENVSLGLSMCAERAALFAAIASDAGQPEILAPVSKSTAGDLTWPCGACLQVAHELCNSDLLIVVSDGRKHETARLGDLTLKMPKKQ